MRRLLRLRPLVLLPLAGPLLFAALAVPGWRHRHAGTAGHVHSHGGVAHSHGGHTHAHSHAREGWHVHLSFFGWEVTLWEPGAEEAPVAERRPVAADGSEPTERETKPTNGEGPVLVATSPVTAGWVSVFLIDPGPLPDRTETPADGSGLPFSLPTNNRCASRDDAPAVPPPEAV